MPCLRLLGLTNPILLMRRDEYGKYGSIWSQYSPARVRPDELGWNVMRFLDSEVRNGLDNCVHSTIDELESSKE